jgi:cbb3-type cytochrome oxidase subunit 3
MQGSEPRAMIDFIMTIGTVFMAIWFFATMWMVADYCSKKK